MSFFGGTEFKVGSMVLAVSGVIAFMSVQVSDNPGWFRQKQRAWFMVPNAAGLVKKSTIKSAGIPVGAIESIELQDGQARIEISVRKDIPLTSSAKVEIKSNGILGDKYVEIYPGAPTDPPLTVGGQILIIKDGASLDNVISQVGDISSSLKDVSDALREALTEDGTRKHVIGRIVKNIETLTGDLAELTTANKGKLNDIIDQVREVTTTLDELINDESDTGFRKTWKNAMVRIDSTLKNIDEIAEKVNKGEGTIGKLINDETTVEELNSAISGVNSLFDTTSRIQMGVDFHSDYLNSIGKSRSYIGLRVQPGLDRFYEIAVIDDPAGVVERERQVATLNGGNPDTSEVEKTFYNKTKFTLLYAKNFWDFTLKGGLIESSGGVGAEYNLWRQRMRFSVEAFDFTRLNLRASARLNLTRGLYLTGGLSDALDKNNARSAYVGAGLFLTNDDLKLLLSGSFF